ncbi:MAG: BatB protein [Desulfobacteraceae bacterium 4572_35.2]|nr:MAG: BatB protein [Desulfobacteraceae bacterium 4572_35.2]
MIQFAWPWAFILLPLPYLVYRLTAKVDQREDSALWVPSLTPFALAKTGQPAPAKQRWRLILAILCWLLLVIACARPQWLGQPVELPVSGRDLMLAVDLSASMQAQDFEINGDKVDRLTALKAVATTFIERRQGDRLGLILFGDKPYIQVPLTFDHITVIQLLDEAVIGLAGKQTAIGDAIGLAIKRLKKQPDNQKVLILLSDGANTAGTITPEKAAELAQQVGLKIYTIGIGADSMEVGSFIFKRTVNPSADLDETMLTYLAETTGGQYFRAHDSQEMTQIYHQLDSMEPVEKEKKIYRPISALYFWPLGAALILCGILLGSRIIRRRP